MADRDGEPKRERGNWTRAGTGVPEAITFAGNIMALVAYAMLFDDGEVTDEPPDLDDSGSRLKTPTQE